MTDRFEADLAQLRRVWAERRARVRAVMARIDPRGTTRPARSPEERAWLEVRGGTPFVEDEEAAVLARAYYERRYGTERGDPDE